MIFFALTDLLMDGILFGYFTFPEIPEKTKMPEMIFSQMDSDPKPETGNAYYRIEVMLTHKNRFTCILPVSVILNI